MVVDALVYHPAVAHYLNFVATTAGRDKLMRTLQFFSRFYSWYLYQINANPAAIKPFAAIQMQFGLARKALRLGKNIEHFKAAKVAADRKDIDAMLKYTAIGRQLGYGMYMTLDAATYLDSAGVKPLKGAKSLGRHAQTAWLTGLSFSVMNSFYILWALRKRKIRLNIKDGESTVDGKKIQSERAAIHLQLLSDCCDLAVPTSSLGWTGFNDGIVGLAGTVSSLVGVYGAWKIQLRLMK